MRSRLKEYEAKRDFSKTPEPGPKSRKATKKRLYGIQKHDASRLHYDFRLEHDGAMLSWAVPKGPSLDPHEKRLAVKVEDHPIDYMRFQGTIPKGEYGAGTVLVWDLGWWQPHGDVDKMLDDGALKFTLYGERLRGDWALIRMHKDEENWLLIKEKDDEVVEGDGAGIVERFQTSVLDTGEPERRLDTKKLSPMLARLVETPPSGAGWVHEVKFDGYRILTVKLKGEIQMITRNGLDWADRFRPIARALDKWLPEGTILDGEMVVFDKSGKSDFGALQSWLKDSKGAQPVYVVFDLLSKEGHDTTRLSLLDRKAKLKALLDAQTGEELARVQYSEHLAGNSAEFFKQACNVGLEGVVSKNAQSTYEQRRSDNWLKCKCVRQDEFVIGGYTDPRGERVGFGALLVGQADGSGGLRYSGKVGSGFKDKTLTSLLDRLRKKGEQTSPFLDPPRMRNVHWVRPEIVVSVKFTEMTASGSLRHPVLLGVREDLEISDTDPRPKTMAPLPIKITHPERVLFNDVGVTKGGLAEYYAKVGDGLLWWVKDRPLAVLRCPEGTDGECFVQKHASPGMPKQLSKVVHGEEEPVLIAHDIKAVLQLVQFGIIEFHCWGSSSRTVEQPDFFILDLDPAEDVPWAKVIEAAEVVEEYLRSLGMVPFVKTTGGKGLHVAVAVKRGSVTWDDLKAFTKQIALNLDKMVPGHFVTVMTKSKRTGRIFLDYLRNGRGATAVAPYSVRARAGAPVSVPVSWSQLRDVKSGSQFTVNNVDEWHLGNPWNGFRESETSLTIGLRQKVQ